MKVFVVGISDAEANTIISIHETYKGALKAWNNERMQLLKQFRIMKFDDVSQGHSHEYDNRWNKNIINLSCKNPKKIDNYPLDTPYITEFEVLP